MLRNLLILATIFLPTALIAAEKSLYENSGLPIPRYVSLKSDEVNARVGPGKRYPIRWVYKRDNLPVEIIEEFGHWRKVRDHDNSEGWVHKSLLSGQRTVLIQGQRRSLHLAPDANSPLVMQADPTVIGILHECNTQWCKIEIDSHEGWIRRGYLWGIYENERIRED